MDTVISTLNSEDFGHHFEVPQQRQQIKTEVKLAIDAAASRSQPIQADNPLYRLTLPSEEFHHPEYYLPQPQPYKVLIHKAANRWWLYKQYERVDSIFKLENFKSKLQHLSHVPQEVFKKNNIVQINDYLSSSFIMSFEEEKKRQLRGKHGNGFSPKLRTMQSKEAPRTYSAAYAREQVKQTPLLLPVLYEHMDRYFGHVDRRFKRFEELLKTPDETLSSKLKSFIDKNSQFVDTRRAMVDPVGVQREVNKLIPSRRGMATDLIKLPNLSAVDVLNELTEYPPWCAYHYHFMRVCSSSKFTLEYNNGMLMVKEDSKRRLVRVKPSRYAFKVQPSRIIRGNKIADGTVLPLDFYKPTKVAPSVSSESGLTTISNMSTATTSPLSWCQDWSVQAPHDDYEHRLAETSIPNEHQSRIQGEKEMLARYNNEVAARIAALQTDMDALREALFLSTRLDPAVVFACEIERRPTPLESPGSLTWLSRVEDRLKKLCTKPQLTADERQDLEALAFAKMRYEPVLRCYEKELDRAEEFKRIAEEDKKKDGPKYLSDVDLSINEAWIRAVECGKIQPSTVETLRTVLSDRDCCVIDSDCSNLMLVKRADKTFKWKNNFNPLRLTLNNNQTRILLYTVCLMTLILSSGIMLLLYLHERYEPFVEDCPRFNNRQRIQVKQPEWLINEDSFRRLFSIRPPKTES